jgi:hypothetical protein
VLQKTKYKRGKGSLVNGYRQKMNRNLTQDYRKGNNYSQVAEDEIRLRNERLQARQIEDLLSGYGSVKSNGVIYSKVSALMEKASI